MAISRFIFVALVFVAAKTLNVQGGIPKVTYSYKATGEIIETLEDETKLLLQVSFDESFDAGTNNSAFRLWIMGKSVTFIENYKTNQTYRYTDDNVCEQMTVEEWIKTKNMPNVLKYEDTNGTVRFSLKQLFSLEDKYLRKPNGEKATFRGIPAVKYAYQFVGKEQDGGGRRIIDIYAYWSEDKSWNTSSSEESVPLGYIISKMEYKPRNTGMQLHEQFIHVYGFVPKAINYKLFEPRQGVICENKTSVLPFPDVSKIKALQFHSEVIFPDYQEIKYVDTWFDPLNKMLRTDMERIKDEVPIYQEKSRKFQREMVLGKMGIVFRLSYVKNIVSCNVLPIKDFNVDLQNLINFKLSLPDWNIGNIFGINKTKYTYIGETSKRDIPCHLFQGVRTDWPEPAAQVESLWEWCFSLNVTTKEDAVIFRNGEYGLVNVQITILSSKSPADFPPKFRIFHHFYDVNKIEPSLMDASKFSIGHCFEEGEKRRLQFEVDWAITDDTIALVENATSDIAFLRTWKQAIYLLSALDPNMLRITDVKSLVLNKTLIVKFTILPPHKSLPQEIKAKQIGSFEAENNFRDKVNARAVFVNYKPSPKATVVRMGAIPHTVKLQINTTFEPHVLPTTTPGPGTTTKRFPFSLLTEPDENSSPVSPFTGTGSNVPVTSSGSTTFDPHKTTTTSKPATPDPLKDHQKYHKAGTVATVSIAMLLIGISIGSTGIFIKMKGLPPCMKCRGPPA